jgi:hypothetical protein
MLLTATQDPDLCRAGDALLGTVDCVVDNHRTSAISVHPKTIRHGHFDTLRQSRSAAHNKV